MDFLVPDMFPVKEQTGKNRPRDKDNKHKGRNPVLNKPAGSGKNVFLIKLHTSF